MRIAILDADIAISWFVIADQHSHGVHRVLADTGSLRIFGNFVFRIVADGLTNKIQDIMKATQTENAVYRPLSTRIFGPDINHDIIIRTLIGFFLQTDALLIAQGCRIVIGQHNTPGHPLAQRDLLTQGLIVDRKVFLQRGHLFRRQRFCR